VNTLLDSITVVTSSVAYICYSMSICYWSVLSS